MNEFIDRLRAAQPADDGGRTWVWLPYDQLTTEIGPASEVDPDKLGIVLVETTWKARRRPYHKQKLALILANQRQFALEQAKRGVRIRYVTGDAPYGDLLEPVAAEHDGLRAMTPAERELRADVAPLVESGALTLVDHEGWLTTQATFEEACGDPPWRMDGFYQHVRKSTGVLMTDDDSPMGGRYSHDGDNREAWRGEPTPPETPTFAPDAVTREVADLVARRFPDHPGEVDLSALPTTQADAETLWEWALKQCLPTFGPYEDAMTTASSTLFHTRISPLVNLHRLLPRRVLNDALALDIPINSLEGFVRQLMGWREFVRHVHVATDGFRTLPDGTPAIRDAPGDGGFGGWSSEPFSPSETPDRLDGGAAPSVLSADAPVPAAYWGAESGLRCLDHVVGDVWREGYSHHITRLMVLANIGTLLDLSPRALTDWFWVAYIDAYDWVVEPNVLAMGTYGVGDLMTTKPYVSGSAYINKMSDYCGDCRFDPKDNCPIRDLYWAFLHRHSERLDGNNRMRLPLASARKRSDAKQDRAQAVFVWVRETLAAGEALTPDDHPA